jgi:prophage maintenance system killer protein|tara:strand:- start:23 stop:1000 length:978 start_codon:yes stop_codon:yes gene_type:complete
MQKGEIQIYKTAKGTEIEVSLDNDSIWLDAHVIATLFNVQRPAIVKHISNIYKAEELDKSSTCSILEQVASDGKKRKMNLYNLDMIISVGYRVNSKQATGFRTWATARLKDYLIKGYAVNEKALKASESKLKSLQQSISLLENIIQQKQLSSDEAVGLLKVVSEYSHALDLLDQYDHQRLTISKKQDTDVNQLEYEEAIRQIILWRDKQNAGGLFGNEKDKSFHSSLETIYQTFEGVDLYPSVEEKAANLLYFTVKNHSFTDGNKRIAAGLFALFLDMNNRLYNANQSKIIADNALVAITIMIAESKTEEKELMIKLIVNLMSKN